MDIADPFSLYLYATADSLTLYYPLSAAVLVVVAALTLLGLVRGAVRLFPALAAIGLIATAADLAGLVLSVTWVLWWSTIEFDRRRDSVRQGGWLTIGRVSDIQGVQCTAARGGPVAVIFRDGEGRPKRWAIPGVRVGQAVTVASLLATVLGVPLS
jgi:hypothetical protein